MRDILSRVSLLAKAQGLWGRKFLKNARHLWLVNQNVFLGFSLNGEMLLDPSGAEMAFDNFTVGEGKENFRLFSIQVANET